MKKVVRYRLLVLAGKLNVELRVLFDSDRQNFVYNEYKSDTTTYLTLNPAPLLQLSIVHKTEPKEKQQWNPSDHLTLTRQSTGTFVYHLNKIMKDFEIPNLYTYRGTKLELNEKVSANVRRAFMCGSTAVEMTPTIIIKEDDKYVEGLKLKFNNEDSVTLLEIDELRALQHVLNSTDVAHITLDIYNLYIHGNIKTSTIAGPLPQSQKKPVIDIPF